VSWICGGKSEVDLVLELVPVSQHDENVLDLDGKHELPVAPIYIVWVRRVCV
jgi:hypothetical protein